MAMLIQRKLDKTDITTLSADYNRYSNSLSTAPTVGMKEQDSPIWIQKEKAEIELDKQAETSSEIDTISIGEPVDKARVISLTSSHQYAVINGKIYRIINEAPPGSKPPSRDASIFKTLLDS